MKSLAIFGITAMVIGCVSPVFPRIDLTRHAESQYPGSTDDSKVVHGVVYLCVEYNQEEECTDWDRHGYAVLDHLTGEVVFVEMQTESEMESSPIEVSWTLYNGSVAGFFERASETIDVSSGGNDYQMRTDSLPGAWKGLSLILHGLYAESIEVEGTAGPDTITCSTSGCEVTATAPNNACTYEGSWGDDEVDLEELTGSSSTRVIVYGGGGNDDIDGCYSCTNILYGGSGQDSLLGGIYADHLDGGDGNDNVLGGAGDDTLIGGSGDDIIRGDTGDDALWADCEGGGGGSGSIDELWGGDDDDELYDDSGTSTIMIGGYGDDIVSSSVSSGFVSGALCSFSSYVGWSCLSGSSEDDVDCGCAESLCATYGTYTDCNQYGSGELCTDECE